jgi:formylglycine-generating enzyme required for sulfatase activity/predicted phosphodiesterase
MSVTWLHVSDIHLSASNPFDRDVVISSLFESVRKYRQSGEWKPDLIFATGDIAERGSVAAFRQRGAEKGLATAFFDDLLEAAGLGKDRLFIVPGNHDIERRMGSGLVRTLMNQKESDEYFDPQAPMYHLSGKMATFASWYNDYFSSVVPQRTFPDRSTCELIPITVNNVRLQMLLLNTAIFCDDSQTDHGKLWLGLRNLDPLIKELQKGDQELAIALIHHPLDWLANEWERTQVTTLLKSGVNVLMHGHYHKTEAELRDDMIEIAAGATFVADAKKDKRALYGRFDGKSVEVFPICYQQDSFPKAWGDDISLFARNENGTCSKRFPLRGRFTEPLAPAFGSGAGRQDGDAYAMRYQASLLSAMDLALPPAVQSFSAKVSEIFVPLRLSDSWRSEERSASIADGADRQDAMPGFAPETVMASAFRKNRLLLLVGDPGSGKTTLLQHYALSALDKEQCKLLGFPEPVLVFYLPLRELRKTDSGYADLPANVVAWSEQNALPIPETVFSGWLHQKRSLVLLDGLDEIGELEERKEVCKWIKKSITSFTNACFVVTSRPTGYQKGDDLEIQVPHKRADILDFNEEQQKQFLQRWFTSLYLDELGFDDDDDDGLEKRKQKAIAKADHIIAFLHKEENRILRQMVRIPLLLQIMAILWNRHDILPDSRAMLYENALDYLLGYQYKQKEIKPLLAVADARKVLAALSLWMQEKEMDAASRELIEARMQIALESLELLRRPSAREFCDDLINRAGVLVAYGVDEYMFSHKSFREYLAGAQIAAELAVDAACLDRLLPSFGVDWWDEPLKFFIAQASARVFDLFMAKLLESPVSDALTPKQLGLLHSIIAETPVEKRKIDALCGKLLDPDATASRQRVIIDCLQGIGNRAALDALEQFRTQKLAKENRDIAGRAEEVILAFGGRQLGDDTAKAGTEMPASFRNNHEQQAEYVLIAGGAYVFSETGGDARVEDLYVAKYPVTNSRYRSFIASLQTSAAEHGAPFSMEGFREALHAIAACNTWGAEFAGYLDGGQNDLAALFASGYNDDRKFGGDDQPVVAITWYAAKAYCLWLSMLDGNKVAYRLPTGLEWEWAAGGGTERIGREARSYPWQDEKLEASPALANFDSIVGQTTPVSRYPEGATPEGLYDMAGNVWEWTEDWLDEEMDARSLRGGSWGDTPDNLRCTARSGMPPAVKLDDFGFRVVCARPR